MVRHPRRAAKMRVRLFAAFVAFVLIVIFLIWSFQIFLLDQFYYQVTKNRMETASYQIEAAYREDAGNFVKNIYNISVNNEFCISVFGSDGKLITSADVGGGCIIHNVGDNLLNQLYAAALENGGSYFHRASLEGFQDGESSRRRFSRCFFRRASARWARRVARSSSVIMGLYSSSISALLSERRACPAPPQSRTLHYNR